MLWNINVYVLNIKHSSLDQYFQVSAKSSLKEILRLEEFLSSSNKCWGESSVKNLKNLMKTLTSFIVWRRVEEIREEAEKFH